MTSSRIVGHSIIVSESMETPSEQRVQMTSTPPHSLGSTVT